VEVGPPWYSPRLNEAEYITPENDGATCQAGKPHGSVLHLFSGMVQIRVSLSVPSTA
jgi:hypothetical protein